MEGVGASPMVKDGSFSIEGDIDGQSIMARMLQVSDATNYYHRCLKSSSNHEGRSLSYPSLGNQTQELTCC